MKNLWVGDFRTKQLTKYFTSDDIYNETLIVDNAEYSWFNSNAKTHITLMTMLDTDVIISLGFNDCVYSSVWSTFKIGAIASDYAKAINSLMEMHSNVNFYFCSVNPVTAGYPHSDYDGGIIPANILNSKIKTFNDNIKNKCKAIFIDSYNYFNTTNLSTRDGVFYTSTTCDLLISFIKAHLDITISNSDFEPRLIAPDVDEDSYIYWTRTSGNGYNPFPAPTAYQHTTNSALPNCTAWAWGRFYEILGSKPNLSTKNAEQWYLNTSDGYERGDIPKLGAVLCWQAGATTNVNGTDGAGHVAIVEQINDDGSIITSESGWNDSDIWWTTKRTNSNGNWGASSTYKFQGFIYNPAMSSIGSSIGYVNKSEVTVSNTSISGATQETNARYIWQYLGSKGWTLNAVAALLGNMQAESAINPGRYEAYTYNKSSSLYLGPNPTQSEINAWLEKYKNAKGRYPGFGLTQWTSTGANSWSEHKLISWCKSNNLDPTDIDSQLMRIEWEAENGKQWYGYKQDIKDYPISFKEFTTSNKEPEWLAAAFLLRYEIPGNRYDYVKVRGENARRWYNFLLPYAPGFAKPFYVGNFKIDSIDTRAIKASFIVTNGKSGYYKITDDTGKQICKVNLSIESEDMLTKVVSFKQNYLTPNTKYQLLIEVFGENDGDKESYTLNFITQQDYPSSVKDIKLTLLNSLTNKYKLQITPANQWGYWKDRGTGYTIQLIINGKCIEEKDISDINIPNFIITDYFKTYKPKLTDNIQIGVRSWVNYLNGKKLFDSDYVITSNTITLLRNPIKVYLNNE